MIMDSARDRRKETIPIKSWGRARTGGAKGRAMGDVGLAATAGYASGLLLCLGQRSGGRDNACLRKETAYRVTFNGHSPIPRRKGHRAVHSRVWQAPGAARLKERGAAG
jgi:hypothetical protein